MDPRFCRHCKFLLPPEAAWCPRCGQPVAKTAVRKRKAHPFLWTVAVVVAALLGFAFLRNHFPGTEPLDPHVARELVSGEGRVALEIPNVLQVRYRDLGQRVELAISAQANPVIVVDENANHMIDAGDLSFQVLPNDKVCVSSALPSDTAPCGATARAARVRVTHNDTWTTATWSIPKTDLTHGQNFADVTFQVFHGDTQQTESYPAEPFSKVYRLQFLDQGENRGVGAWRPEAPRPATPPPDVSLDASPAAVPPAGIDSGTRELAPEVLQFDATPAAVTAGAQVKLQWSVRGGTSVRIEPDVGAVAPQGSISIAPPANQRYVLSATGPGGAVTRELTVGVSAPGTPVISNFSADSTSLQPGGSTRLQWAATGSITRVQLDPIAPNVPDHGMQDVSPAQTTEYTLTAEGAGGSVSSTLTVHVATPPPTLPAPSISFTATPATIAPGEPVTLHWHVTGADAVSIEPAFGQAGPEGTEIVRPVASIEYALTARGKGGVSGRQVAISVRKPAGAASGRLVWSGEVHGTQLVTITRDQADVGQVEGSLPGAPCLVQPISEKNVSIAAAPGPANEYSRLVLRIKGSGMTRVEIQWSLQ